MFNRLSVLPRLTARTSFLIKRNVSLVQYTSKYLNENNKHSIQAKPSHISDKKMTIERELPDPTKQRRKGTHPVTFLLYLGVIYISAELIFNYERMNNTSVNNSLLELRRDPEARKLLGSNIKLYGLYPWIYGEIQQVKGNVDIWFKVTGNTGRVGVVKFKAMRELNELNFVITEWKMTMEDNENDSLDILKFNGDENVKL